MARQRGNKTTFRCSHCAGEIMLVGSKEVMELLGMSRSTLQYWTETDSFPEPAWDGGQGKLWHRDEVLEWNRRRLAKKQASRWGVGKLTRDELDLLAAAVSEELARRA